MIYLKGSVGNRHSHALLKLSVECSLVVGFKIRRSTRALWPAVLLLTLSCRSTFTNAAYVFIAVHYSIDYNSKRLGKPKYPSSRALVKLLYIKKMDFCEAMKIQKLGGSLLTNKEYFSRYFKCKKARSSALCICAVCVHVLYIHTLKI